MPVKQVGLKSWDVIDLELIVNHYGVQKCVGACNFLAIIDIVVVRH